MTIFKEKTLLHRWEQIVRHYLRISSEVNDRKKPLLLNYKNTTKKINIEIPHRKFIPCVFPNWDNSPRSGNKSLVLQHSSPEIFGLYLQKMIEKFQKDPQNQPYIVIKSWNEWAEGNYLEPDEKHGRAWLKVIKDIKSKIE